MENKTYYSFRISMLFTVLFATIAPSLYAEEQSRIQQAAAIVTEYAGRASQATQKVARCTLGLEGCTQEEITQARVLTSLVAAALAVLSGGMYVRKYGLPFGRQPGQPTSPEFGMEQQMEPMGVQAPQYQAEPIQEQQQTSWQERFMGKPMTEQEKRRKQQEAMERLAGLQSPEEKARQRREELEFKKQQEASRQRQYAFEEDLRRKQEFERQQEALKKQKEDERQAEIQRQQWEQFQRQQQQLQQEQEAAPQPQEKPWWQVW